MNSSLSIMFIFLDASQLYFIVLLIIILNRVDKVDIGVFKENE